jgi:hypothetical protein
MRKILTFFTKKAPQPVPNERRSFMSGVLIEIPELKVRTIEPDLQDFNERSEHIYNERKKMYESKIVLAQ